MMMKRSLTVIALSVLPTLALAAEHAGGHDMHAHDMHAHSAPTHGMPGHDMSTMVSASGQPGDPAEVTRTIELTMDDTMRFTPSDIEVNKGDTIRFFIKNTGTVAHEMVIGSLAELQAHAAEMQNMPGMTHADANMATLAPGKLGGIVWKFDQPGTVDFACLIPGHLEAGMVGRVNIR